MKKITRISTDSIELALEQLIRTRTSGTKASIKPLFVIEVLKELIDRRHEESVLYAEFEELFMDDDFYLSPGEDRNIVVEEVMSLSQLGTSSCDSSSNLEKIEWKAPEPLDESDVTYEVLQRPVLRAKRRSGVMRAGNRWHDGYTTRRVIIFTLLTIIVLTFIPVFLVF